jgi:hypothetical protein
VIRRINHTSRKRIERNSIDIRVLRSSPVSAQFDFDLSGYGFPVDATVIAEAYGQSRLARVNLGPVGTGKVTGEAALTAFANADALHFRIKVIPAAPLEARLLGLAEGVSPDTEGDGPARSLLPVRTSELGQMVWRLAFEEVGPVLEVNRDLAVGSRYVREPEFVALAQVEILRQILHEALTHGGEEEGSEGNSWQSRWIRLGERFAGRKCDSDGELTEEHKEWIRDACERFAQDRKLLTTLNQLQEART